jgi:Protein of unknown function (DUF2628)
MRLFTVHVPVSVESGGPDFERAQFVRDGFHKWAFLFSAFWCAWRGLWIAALAVILVSAALFGIGRVLALPLTAQLLLQFVFALLLGLEAPNIIRLALSRQGYIDAGTVAAADEDEAEGLFFGQGADQATQARSPLPSQTVASTSRPRFVDDIIGLFPEHRGR